MIDLIQRRREMMGASGGGILPQGYTQLNYIENTDKSCIEIAETLPFTIELEFAPDLDFIEPGFWYGCMFGTNGQFQAAFASPGKASIGNATSSAVFFADNVRAKAECLLSTDYSQTYYHIDGGDTGLKRSSSGSLWYIFSATATGSYPARGKMYSFKLWNKDNELTMELIPCVDPNNIYGMYDIINDTFYSSITSNPFVGG